MNFKIIFSAISLLTICVLTANANDFQNLKTIESDAFIASCDSDIVDADRNMPVISMDKKLYQKGIQIGTFEKKTSMKKGQLTVTILIFDMEGKAVAEAIGAGINVSFAITVYEGNEKLSLDLDFDHEAEQLALKLRQIGKL
jgi:hypothetical protein